MKVICFKGKANTGKSSIVKRILNKFFKIYLIPEKKDFCLSFMYKDKKIGICSYGDDHSVLKKLKELKKQGCSIILCASRTKGGLVLGIERMFGIENIKYIICDGNYRDKKKIAQFGSFFKN